MTTPRQFTLYTFEDLNITATLGGVFYDGGEPATATDGDLNAITVNLTDDDGYLEDQPGAYGANDSGDNQVLTEDISDEGTTYLEAGENIYALGSGTYYNETTGETGTYWVIGSSSYTSSEFGISTSSPINAGDVISYGQIDYYDNALPYGTIVAPEPEPDGVVDGEATGEVMDVGYDDADGATDGGGDLITNGDDTILGNGGNDTITAGGGDDLVEGGSGDDSIDGGTGADTIYGDNASDAEATFVRESFEWDELNGGAITDGTAISDVTQDTGNVTVGFRVLSSSGAENQFATEEQNVSGIDDGSETIDDTSGFSSDLTPAAGGSASYELTFDQGVENLDFRINDADGSAIVSVRAYDADGNEIPVDFTLGSGLSASGSTGFETAPGSIGHYADEDSAQFSALVEVAGPVSRIVIDHSEGDYNSGIWFSDVYFDAPEGVVDTGEPGDDTIDGGEGADLIYGQDGDDSILGGSGEDTIYGDSGAAEQTYSNLIDINQKSSFVNSAGDTVTQVVTSNTDGVDAADPDESALDDGYWLGNNKAGATDANETHTHTFGQEIAGAELKFTLLDGTAPDNRDSISIFLDGQELDLAQAIADGTVVLDNSQFAVDPHTGQLYNTSGDTFAIATLDIRIPFTSLEVENQSPFAGGAIYEISAYGDEVVEGGAAGEGGNDTIDGGESADLIYGQEGDDSLLGGTGDDTIYGDSGSDAVVSGGEDYTLDWSGLPASGSTTLTSGGEDVDVTYTSGSGWTTGNIGGTDVLQRSSQNDDAPVEIAFDTPVENLTFELFDIDEGAGGWDDEFTILALDVDGNPVEIQVTNTAHHVVTENLDGSVEIDSGGAYNPGVEGSGAVDSVTVTIPGPVSEVTIIHGPGEVASITGTVGIADLSFTTVETTEGAEGGDDTLIGGEGADVLYGEGGDDTFVVASGEDGDGDVITGGAGPDDTADNDTLDLRGAGRVTIDQTTDATDSGAVTGTVTFENGETLEFSQIETILTDPQNVDPDAQDDSETLDEDTSVTFNPLANDSDGDGDDLTVVSFTDPEHGTLVQNPDGTFTYTPDADYNGDDSFTYTVEDGFGGSDTATVNLTVTPVNDAPVAADDTASTPEDTPIIIDVLGNDSDVDGDDLTVTAASSPNGDVTINPDGTLTFTPDENYNGPAEITYTVEDGEGGSDEGTVTVDVTPVNDAPVAADDTASTPEDTPIIIDVLGNDSDVDGDDLTVTAASSPNGDVTINPDGTLTFTPDENYNGPAEITYTVEDGEGGSDEGTVTVDVTPVNDAPVAADDTATTPEDTPVIIDVLGNDTDVDGDDLTVTAASSPNGDVTINPDGTLTFTPDENYNGPAEITYTVEDGEGGSDEGTVTVDVTPVNDAPVAEDDTATTPEDTPIIIDVLGNDSDVDGDDLTVTAASSPNGDVTINPDGTLTFTPDENYNGPAEITYTVEDGEGGSDEGTVTVDVTPVNDAPVAEDDTASTDFETAVVIPVLANDTDVDGDDLTVTEATSPNGTVVINGDGTLTFTPDAGFEGPTTIEYSISDGNGGTDSATVDVTVNDQPLDGIVEGTDGGDLIDVDYVGDPEGDRVDNNDEILPGEGPNDDIIEAGGGNDTVFAGEGDDDIRGGTGNDSLVGEEGDDSIKGGSGQDTLDGGEGDDTLLGGGNRDTILGGEGSDSVLGEGGNDLIETGNGEIRPDIGYPGLFPADDDPEDDRDFVDGGSGNDTISTGDDADTIIGGSGNDEIDGGIDADSITGDEGADRIVGGEGSDTILGGIGNDTIYAGNDPDDGLDSLNIEDDGSNPFGPDLAPDNGQDLVYGGEGDDLIFGADDDDTLYGETGNDTIDGGIDDDLIDGGADDDSLIGGQGDDTLLGGSGDDVLSGGIGADSLDGGADRDTFEDVTAGDTVDGGGAGDDYDVLDLTGSIQDPDGDLTVTITGPDSNGNGVDGFVTYFDEDGNETGRLDFTEIEEIIPCFTPGTLIATPQGEVAVELLKEGDQVITRDNGLQTIRWAGVRTMSTEELSEAGKLRPVMIRAGALGKGQPQRDMVVSPNHRVLVNSGQVELLFEENEVLVAAKHLVGLEGVERLGNDEVTYIHIMFDQHEVVLSDGAWTESFQPGDMSLKGVGREQREEILAIFPELATRDGVDAYVAARRVLKKHEAALLRH